MTPAAEHALAHIKVGRFSNQIGFVWMRSAPNFQKQDPRFGMPMIAYAWIRNCEAVASGFQSLH